MLIVVSPAKNLDYESPNPLKETTLPRMLEDTHRLVKKCRSMSPAALSSLMKISDKLAHLNAQRFQSFASDFTQDNAKAAIYAFNGDVYAGLDAKSLQAADIEFAQTHLRILSGLYGVLRPMDLMQAYRLEMGTKLAIGKNTNLYQFWGDRITLLLNQDLNAQGDNILLNLASNEYFSAVKQKALEAMVLTPQFKDEKNGQFKVISFYAKKARGLMARFVIQNRIKQVNELVNFDLAGYRYDPSESTQTTPVFKRRAKDII